MIDLFTEDEVQRAKAILKDATNSRAIGEILTDEVMQRIDAETGQANGRSYMAYRLEYVAGAEG